MDKSKNMVRLWKTFGSLTFFCFQIETTQKQVCSDIDMLEVKLGNIDALLNIAISEGQGFCLIEEKLSDLEKQVAGLGKSTHGVSENVREMERIFEHYSLHKEFVLDSSQTSAGGKRSATKPLSVAEDELASGTLHDVTRCIFLLYTLLRSFSLIYTPFTHDDLSLGVVALDGFAEEDERMLQAALKSRHSSNSKCPCADDSDYYSVGLGGLKQALNRNDYVVLCTARTYNPCTTFREGYVPRLMDMRAGKSFYL